MCPRALSFCYAFGVILSVAPGDKDHLDAKTLLSSTARLLERNFSKGCFKRKRSSLIDVIVDEAFHSRGLLLTETHVLGNVLRFLAGQTGPPAPMASPSKLAAEDRY